MVKKLPSRITIIVLLSLMGIIMVLPFYWMIITSLKTPLEAVQFPPSWFPHHFEFRNYIEAWKQVPFPRYFLNTIIITLATLIGVLITSSLAAYSFASMQYRGRNFIFLSFLAMMMIPIPVYIIPGYLILTKLHWVDTYFALTVPWLANVFSIFLLRQHFKTIPKDLYDAAVMDGCSRLGFLIRIVLPLSKAVLVTVSLFSIIGSWNSFIWPLVVTSRDALRPIQVGLAYFIQEQSANYTLLTAAAVFSIAPIVLLFIILEKKISSSFTKSGLKG
jgi:ABC-type glycerol-3-phosphate transport system permease component